MNSDDKFNLILIGIIVVLVVGGTILKGFLPNGKEVEDACHLVAIIVGVYGWMRFLLRMGNG